MYKKHIDMETKRMQTKAVFLDRDGTINKYVDFLHRIEDFKLIEGVGEAIRLINASGYLCIVITNQPMITMGMLSEPELAKIHSKLKWQLWELTFKSVCAILYLL